MKRVSAVYEGKPLPPAIPDQSPVCETRFFELSESVTVFDEPLIRGVFYGFCDEPVGEQISMFE